jgi:membrane protease subunit HflK
MTGLLAGMSGLYIVDEDQQAMVPWLSVESGAQPSSGGKIQP